MDLILLFFAVTAVMVAVGSIAYTKNYDGFTTLIIVMWSVFTMITMTIIGGFILARVI